MVLTEIRNGLEVRHQVAGQPHQLDIALALPLKPSARLDAIEISVNVDLQQRRRMISRSARGKGRDAVKAELGKIQPIDKDIDRPHRIILAYIVIQHRGKQRALTAIRPLDKALSSDPPHIAGNHSARINPDRAFSHSLGHFEPPRFEACGRLPLLSISGCLPR
jgi:hypothetical protein